MKSVDRLERCTEVLEVSGAERGREPRRARGRDLLFRRASSHRCAARADCVVLVAALLELVTRRLSGASWVPIGASLKIPCSFVPYSFVPCSFVPCSFVDGVHSYPDVHGCVFCCWRSRRGGCECVSAQAAQDLAGAEHAVAASLH